MKLNFCTLFNANYLSRGLVMYDSLMQHCKDFNLYVFAFDDACADYLIAQSLKNLVVIRLNEFEDEKLLSVKSSRTAAEYCWTSTPSTILYCLTKFDLNHCTYIDADLLFYADPIVLVQEMGQKSVLITEHRYSPQHDQSERSGKYCVQFITAKNDFNGLKTMHWWRNACIDWCYARHEDGKFGDQKYLDNWPQMFDGIHELQNLGGGVAPWNVQQYEFFNNQTFLKGIELKTKNEFNLIFFHFHGFKYHKNNLVALAENGYELSKNVQNLIFKPYAKKLFLKGLEISKTAPEINYHAIFSEAPYGEMSPSTLFKYYLNGIKSSKRNVISTQLFQKIKQHYYFKVNKL